MATVTKNAKNIAKASAPVKESNAKMEAGSVVVGGQRFTIKGHATLPTLQMAENQTRVLRVDAEIQTKAKTDRKGAPLLDQESGEPLNINTVKVVDVQTGEMGTMVVGVVLLRALQEYQGGDYVGKTFAVTKNAAKEGKRAKEWSVIEVG